MAWDGHALAHQPLDFFQANQFWPLHDTLAFSDALVGYAPRGPGRARARTRRSSATTCCSCSPTRSRSWAPICWRVSSGSGRGGAAVAGAAFAFAPLRLEQDGHMQVISSGGIPLALAFACRGATGCGGRLGVAGWLVAAWQLSIGFTLGLPFAYLLAAVAVDRGDRLAAATGRPRLDRGLAIATVAGAVLFAARRRSRSAAPTCGSPTSTRGEAARRPRSRRSRGRRGSSSSRPRRTSSGAARPRRSATASRTSPRRRCFRAS